MGRIVIEADWGIGKREAVDAVASIALKEDHKKYGEYMKKLSDLLKQHFRIAKGDWQKYWTIATRVFSIYYGGHDQKTGEAIARELGREMKVPDATKIAKVVYENMDYILGVHARSESPTGGARR